LSIHFIIIGRYISDTDRTVDPDMIGSRTFWLVVETSDNFMLTVVRFSAMITSILPEYEIVCKSEIFPTVGRSEILFTGEGFIHIG
jgi:hypothetical protein